MSKKILFKAIFFIFIAVFSNFVFSKINYVISNNFKISDEYTTNTDPKYVRIYYDYATMSSIYEAYDFLIQHPESTVFLRWDRTPFLKEKLAGRKNLYVLEHTQPFDHSPINPAPVIKYYKEHPQSQFIIYTTSNWIVNLSHILYTLPKKAIKEIHVFEDGSYSSLFIGSFPKEKVARKMLYVDFAEIPKIYHMEDAKYLNSLKCLFDKKCVKAKNLYKDDIVIESSIDTLKEKLNKNQRLKEMFFYIFDFDYKYYQKVMTHPFGVYTFSMWVDDKIAEKELAFMNEILNGKLNYLIKDKNVKWFYKEHPHAYQKHNFSEILPLIHPEMIRITKTVPLEFLLLADIIPDYLAGYSSGIYLSFPRKSISAYINRPNDVYMYIINRDHKIRPGRIFKITDIDNSFKSKLKRLKSRLLVSFQ